MSSTARLNLFVMRLKATLFVAVVLIGSAGAQVDSAVSPTPTRTVTGATIIGKATPVVSASSTTTVYNFLGIPYAAAPTGSLRFLPPKAPGPFKQPIQATAYGPGCIQQLGRPGSGNDILINRGPTSEDCLYLNVYTPVNVTLGGTSGLKPVLFFQYGGNLQNGASSIKTYNGSSFAGFQDVIVVTFNYRLSIFGFSNSPQVPLGSQNSGWLDARAALAWVRDNIQAFGGDPNQVTIWGQSVGAYGIKQILAHPPSPPGYRAAIIESEAINLPGNGTKNYLQTAEHFNCSDPATQLSCLQKVDATALESYVNSTQLMFAPVDDNVTQSNNVTSSIDAKRFSNVPLLLGSTADEARYIANGAQFNTGGINAGKNLSQAVAIALNGTPSGLQANVVRAYTPYYVEQGNNTYVAISRILTDFAFDCQAGLLINYTISHGYPNAWRYYYNASFANVNYFPNAGSFHASDLPQVWGTYDLVNQNGAATATQISLSRFLQTTWANFAKAPSSGPGWVKYTGGVNTVAQLGGASNATGLALISPYVPDQFCYVLNAFILAGGISGGI